MADVVRTLIIRSTTEGVQESTAALKGLKSAQDDLAKSSGATATVTDMASRSQLSMEAALKRAERQFNVTLRAQQDFEKLQRQMNLAVAQNPALQDRANAVLSQAALKYGQAGVAARAFEAATSGVSAQIIALSAGAGPVGVFLSALGPWGIAAAAGIGLASAALNHMVEEAGRIGDLARQLKDTAATVGLGTDALQTLNEAASRVGITAETNTQRLERFTVSLAELKDGTGTLFKELSKVNPALVAQLSVARDNATAWNLLAQAYANADAKQQALITRAAFGRGGQSEGGLLLATSQAGGIGGLPTPEAALTPDQVEKWSRLRTEIESSRKAAADMMAILFTGEVLQREKQGVDELVRAASTLKEMKDGGILPWLTEVQLKIAGFLAGAGLTGVAENIVKELAPPSTGGFPSGAAFGGGDTRTTATSTAATTGAVAASIGVQAENARLLVSALGSAATITEQFRVRQLELTKALKDQIINFQQYGRASAVLSDEESLQKLQERISLLGNLASGNEAEEAMRLRINLATAKGINLATEESAALKERAGLQQEFSRLPSRLEFEREQIGRGDIDAAVAQRLRAENLPINLNSATAQQIRLNEQLRAAKTITDEFANSVASNLTTALADMATGTKSAADAFKALGNTVVRALEEMIIKLTIAAPLAESLKSALGGGLLGAARPASAAEAPASAAEGSYFSGTFHSGGIVGSEPTSMRYIHPAYYENAPRFHSGLMPGEVPAILQQGESVLTPGQMSAIGGALRAPTVVNNFNVQNTASGVVKTSAQQQKNATGGTDFTLIIEQIENHIAGNVSDGRGPLNSSLFNRYGLTPKFS